MPALNRVRRAATTPIADQAVLSGGNLLLGVLAAKGLGLRDFGLFTVLQTAAVLMAGSVVAVVVEPLSALARGRFSEQRASYLEAVRRASIVAAVVFCILGIAAAVVGLQYGGAAPVDSLLTAAFGGTQLLFVFARRRAYVEASSERAVLCSATASAVLVVGAASLVATRTATLTWFLVVACLGPLVASITAIRGPLFGTHTSEVDAVAFRRAHWSYGAWTSGTGFVAWLAGLAFLPLIAEVRGLEAVAVMRLAQMAFSPLVQGSAALQLARVPRLASELTRNGSGFTHALRRGLGTYSKAAGAYAVVVGGAAAAALHLAGPPSERFWYLSIVIALDSAAEVLRSSMASVFNAVGWTRPIFVTRLYGIAGGAAVLLLTRGAWTGVLVAFVVTSAVPAVALWLRAERQLRDPQPGIAEEHTAA